MVAGFQDELDSEDEAEVSKASAKPSLSTIPSQDLSLSSDNDEENDGADDAQSKPVIISDGDRDIDAAVVAMPKYDESVLQRTSQNVNQTSGTRETIGKDTEGSKKVSSENLDSDDSSVDNEDTPAVTVLADEDLSEDDATTSSSKPADSGLATDTTQVRVATGLHILT